jgi:hypothetical protein
MENDVQMQVEKLKYSLGVADRIESERSGASKKKRKHRMPRPDYSRLHQMQDRLEELNRPPEQPVERDRVNLPPVRKQQTLSLPNITPAAPEMLARVGYCKNELKKTEKLLRDSLDEQSARAPFLPAPGVQVKATKSLGNLHATVFTSESRAQFRGAPGLIQMKSLPAIDNRRAPYF